MAASRQPRPLTQHRVWFRRAPGARPGSLVVVPVLLVWLTVPSLVLALTVVAVVTAALDADRCGVDHAVSARRGSVAPVRWSAKQAANARLITSVVMRRGLPPRAAVLAVATALAESGLHNLRHGDRDSLGLFQQRPTQGWGDSRKILDPIAATNQFLDHLLALPGWSHLAPGVAEQTVQRSAHPDAYAARERPAIGLVTHYWTQAPPDSPRSGSGEPPRLLEFPPDGCPPSVPTAPPRSLGRVLDPRQVPTGYQLPTDPAVRAALVFALEQVGKPYRWGAAGPTAFDCSGLVQASWAAAGVRLSRTTATQVHDGTPVADLAQLQPGDLLFIPGDEGSRTMPGHVGLAAGAGWVIDAYDDSHGIVIEPLARWAPKIAAIRRVTNTNPRAYANGG